MRRESLKEVDLGTTTWQYETRFFKKQECHTNKQRQRGNNDSIISSMEWFQYGIEIQKENVSFQEYYSNRHGEEASSSISSR